MTDGVTVTVTGLSELETALKELPKATQSRIVRKAGVAAGERIADQAQAYAPKEEGTLWESIHVRFRSLRGRAGKAAFAAVMRSGGSRAAARDALIEANRATSGDNAFIVTIGTGAHHAHLQEFGTVHHGPQPFMRPAWDALREAAVRMLKNVLAEEIRKAARRLARKRARAKAKGR